MGPGRLKTDMATNCPIAHASASAISCIQSMIRILEFAVRALEFGLRELLREEKLEKAPENWTFDRRVVGGTEVKAGTSKPLLRFRFESRCCETRMTKERAKLGACCGGDGQGGAASVIDARARGRASPTGMSNP